MKLIITVFIIITASISCIAAFGQLLVKERKQINYVLFALLFCLTVLQIQAIAFLSGMIFSYPILFFFHTTALYMLGTIRYFAYFLVSLRSDSIPGKKLLYFIPSCFALAFDLYYLTLPDANKMRIITDLFTEAPVEQSMYLKMLL